MKVKYYKFIALLLLSQGISAQVDPSLNNKVSQFFNSGLYANSNASVSVIEIASSKEVIAYRSNKMLVPASSLKLFTNFSGLKKLGPNFQFVTTIGYDGKIDSNGTLTGNLVIKGGGDPTLGSNAMKDAIPFKQLMEFICAKILSNGINCINGKIIIDQSIYDPYPANPSWQWNDLGNYYATGAWGLNVNENIYTIEFDNSLPLGSIAKIKEISPNIEGLHLLNEIKIAESGSGDQAYIYGGPMNNSKRIVGTIPKGNNSFIIKGAVPNPPLFFGQSLRSKLAMENIYSNGVEVDEQTYQNDVKEIAKIYSPNLSDIVKKANIESNNLYTEAILKMMGAQDRGQGATQNGLDVVLKVLENLKISSTELLLHDGCGLSARNNVSSKSLAHFLSQICKDLGIETSCKYLAKGSYEGTARYMFKNSPAQGQIWLKSGSMEGIQSYTGILKSKTGKWFSFSIIVNGFTSKGSDIRKSLEKLLIQLHLDLD